MQSVHRDDGAGLYRLQARVTTGRARRERPGALLARRTRTMKLCSSDARSRGQPWPLSQRKVERTGTLSLGGNMFRVNGCKAAGDWAGEVVRAVGDRISPPSCMGYA